MRVLVVGWFSLRDGETQVGDVLSVESVCSALRRAGCTYDVVWTPGFRSSGPFLDQVDRLDQVDPAAYTHLIFVCGPVCGPSVRELHERFASCRRIAVGVTVLDPADRAATGFHALRPRDGTGIRTHRDLVATAITAGVPVAGIVLRDGGQQLGDHGMPSRNDSDDHDTAAAVGNWLADRDCACLPLDIWLSDADWRRCGSTAQFESLVRRLDIVVTTHPHGLALGLKNGVPVLAVESKGGTEVTTQAAVWHWPAVIPADRLTPQALDRWWGWCLSSVGRADAEACRSFADLDAEQLLRCLPRLLHGV